MSLPRVNVGSGSGPAFVSDAWGGLQLQVTNPRDEPAELLSLTYFGTDDSLQFGRRVWVPPHARLRTWQPIRLPPAGESKVASVEYHTLLSDSSSSTEVLIPDSVGRMVRDGALPLGTRVKVTGFIDTKDQTPQGESAATAVYDLLLAARSQSALSLRTSFFYESPLPFYGPESLEALDCLVIADSRILSESAALAAVRRWLYGGGRLWVLLDQVDPPVLEALLGDEWGCQIVDRIGLTQVQIDAGPAGVAVPSDMAEFEEPVELVRVVAADIDVMYTVRQGGIAPGLGIAPGHWPAAIMKRCGDGQLLVTTLGPDGWLRRPQLRDRTLPPGMTLPAGPPPPETREPAVALRNLAADFFSEPPPPLLPAASLEPVVREYIGYRIPPAWIVVGLLGLFNVLLVVAGVALWRMGRLDRIGFVVPVAALAVSILLIVVGRTYRQGLVPTAARVQIVQVLPGTDDQRVWGATSLSSESTLPAEIAGTHGGWAEMKLPEGAAATRRLIFTDHETWHWEHLRQPAGLQLATFQSSTTAAPRVEAIASFTDEGLAGKLHIGEPAVVEDAMIVTRDGRVSVRLDGDGNFTAPAEGVMSHGQFLSAGLLTDEQNRRQRVLSELFAGKRRVDYPDRPHLFFWMQSWDSGIDFGSKLRPIGSTLVTVPLVLARPEAGSEVLIPSPLITFRSVGGPDGTAAGGMFDNRQRQWLERSRPSVVWLEFQVPRELLPLEPAAARLTVQVNGPVKQLEVSAFHEGQVLPLQTWPDPVGTITATLTDDAYLRLSPAGTLRLRIAGGGVVTTNQLDAAAAPSPGRASFWQIESLRLELRGRVLSGNDVSLPSSPPR
jgi:hypothetical protein